MKYYSSEVNKLYCLLQFNSDYLITGEDNIFQLWKGIFPVSNGKVMAHKGKVLCMEKINENKENNMLLKVYRDEIKKIKAEMNEN